MGEKINKTTEVNLRKSLRKRLIVEEKEDQSRKFIQSGGLPE